MTGQERIRLRRLVTDLEPFVEAIRRSTDKGNGEIWLSAHRASEALEAFMHEANGELKLK